MTLFMTVIMMLMIRSTTPAVRTHSEWRIENQLGTGQEPPQEQVWPYPSGFV